MFRAAHRSSSGALNSIFSPWFIYPCGDWPLTRMSGKSLIVKQDGCVRFIRFPFGVLISVYIYGLFGVYKLDIHRSVHRRLLSRNTNKKELCNRIYYSKVYWRLNMFRAGTPLIIRSSKLYLQPLVYIPMWWPAVVKAEWEIFPRGCKYSLELLMMMSGVPLETCWDFNKLWNNKFYYKLHLVGIATESYYDARIHEYQIYKKHLERAFCCALYSDYHTTGRLI
jgi:hypothetical protein